ncbi:hypothetical protein H920_09470 [Fukomys damarensis]|uniref:Uncharacterized protein n=1 Tax=Fukomys damarensis TaxID=885580 RepID=A0A091DFR1_FUKDA|nr:hypothetical protein H920_09470 [Fukomys damarensis]
MSCLHHTRSHKQLTTQTTCRTDAKGTPMCTHTQLRLNRSSCQQVWVALLPTTPPAGTVAGEPPGGRLLAVADLWVQIKEGPPGGTSPAAPRTLKGLTDRQGSPGRAEGKRLGGNETDERVVRNFLRRYKGLQKDLQLRPPGSHRKEMQDLLSDLQLTAARRPDFVPLEEKMSAASLAYLRTW